MGRSEALPPTCGLRKDYTYSILLMNYKYVYVKSLSVAIWLIFVFSVEFSAGFRGLKFFVAARGRRAFLTKPFERRMSLMLGR